MQTELKISPDHPAFAGHFPAFPVLPGAILLDEMLNAIELARGIDLKRWHISAAKFLDAVRPGDHLVLEHDSPAARIDSLHDSGRESQGDERHIA